MRNLLKLILGICLLAVISSISQAQKGASDEAALKKRFEKARLMPLYDAAKDETNVYMMALSLTEPSDDSLAVTGLRAVSGAPPQPGVKFTVYLAYPGRTFVAPQNVTLRLASTSISGPKFTGSGEVLISMDGNTRSFGGAVVNSRKYNADIPKRGTEYVDEMLDVSVPIEDLNRLAAAKAVELKIGGTSLTMKERHLKALRRVVEAIGVAQ